MTNDPGNPVFTVNGTIPTEEYLRGAALRGYVEERLGVNARQARASISSWSVEGWIWRDEQGQPFTLATSVDNRCAVQIDARNESRRTNGAFGGRPRHQEP